MLAHLKLEQSLAGEEQGNRRNGYGKKTVMTDSAEASPVLLSELNAAGLAGFGGKGKPKGKDAFLTAA